MSRLTKVIQLTLLGSTTVLTTGCDNLDNTLEVRGYENVDQCVESRVYTPDFCKRSYDQALARHQSSAPRFETREDCERDFGKDRCEDRTTFGAAGRGGYTPVMRGYAAGSDRTGTQSISPLYRSSAGEILTDSGERVPSTSVGRNAAPARMSGVSLAKPATVSPVSRGSSFTSSRGGFGSVGRGFSAPSVGG